jgi:hypothetical protein
MAARLAGNGVVVAQDPVPGSPIVEGTVCRLTLDRARITRAEAAAP